MAIPWWMPTAAATEPVGLVANSSHINSNDFNDNSTLFSSNNSVMTAYHRPVLTDIVSNDTGADSDLLSIEEFTIDGYTTVYQPGDTATVPNIGTLSITTNGMLTFTPNEGYAGAVPDVTYTMTGGHGDCNKGTIIFNDVSVVSKQSAVAHGNRVKTAHNMPVEIKILSNNTDLGSDPLSVEGFTIEGYTTVYQSGDMATIPNVGIITITNDGTLNFTPNDGYVGAVPDVTYTVIGGHGDCDKGTIIFNDVSVVSKQSAVAHGNRVKTAHNMPVEIKFFGNNTDPESDPLSVEGFTIEGYTTVYQSGDMATIPNVGIITITNDGTLNFTPNDGYAGAVPDVTYTVIGCNGSIDTAIVTFDDVPAGVAGINFDGTEDIAATAADIIDAANQPTADAFDIDLTDLSLSIQKWSTSSYTPV